VPPGPSAVLALVLATSMFGATHSARGSDIPAGPDPVDPPASMHAPTFGNVEARLSAAELDVRALHDYHTVRIAPLIAALDTRMAVDRTQLTRIAIALVREGHEAGVDPRLLLAVLLVENPWLDPTARSPMGAMGLMQVMPFHAGNWGCGGADLTDADHNICHGARILAAALARSGGDLDQALLRYNGCVHGTNTPDCHQYPQWVYRRAGDEWMADITNGLGVWTDD
jgi:hypothetical protein